tara:strand:- start:3496 stop:4425 length:930 start_codon:yes stop_codon:yes gene_type:complete
MAGFKCEAAIEIDKSACATLAHNRPGMDIRCADVKEINGLDFRGIDLFAGGVPCPPFSIAGQQLGQDDERDLFPAALNLIDTIRPTAVLLENVRGLASKRFDEYRKHILQRLAKMGYMAEWDVLNASDFGVPQLRPRFVLIAIREKYFPNFAMPTPVQKRSTVASSIGDLMGSQGWLGHPDWMLRADQIAPTLVGGSKKHGGADLGPTRAKRQWAELGVDGMGIANEVPNSMTPIDHKPRLTLRMAARIQGFPDSWHFVGGKTSQYRQIGNAFPPPVAAAVANQIRLALSGKQAKREQKLLLPLSSAAD